MSPRYPSEEFAEMTDLELAAPVTDMAEVPRRRAPRRRLPVAKSLVVVADAAAITGALLVAYVMRSDLPGPSVSGAVTHHVLLGALAVPIWLILFSRRRLYTARTVTRRIEELRRVVNGSAATILCLAAIGYLLQLSTSRSWLALAGGLGILFVAIEREAARQVFALLRRRGRLLRKVAIVGSNDEATAIAAMLHEEPWLGYQVVGHIDDHDHAGNGILGPIEATLHVLGQTGATGVIVAASAMSVGVSNRLVRELVRSGVHVELSSTLRDVAPERLTIRPLGRFPVVYIEPRHTVGWRAAAKRAFDIAIAGLGVLAVAPLALAVAVAIKLDSEGPVLFRQSRVGRNGELFAVWKFRTMVPDAEVRIIDLLAENEADGPLFKLKNDPRVTRVGKFLRKTSLDELPQLVNVLRGDMSVVGPRPALPLELLSWDPELHARLRVKPGITGMWQVSGRSDASFESYSRLDLYYVENWSLVTDLAILAKTVPTVLFGRGAY